MASLLTEASSSSQRSTGKLGTPGRKAKRSPSASYSNKQNHKICLDSRTASYRLVHAKNCYYEES